MAMIAQIALPVTESSQASDARRRASEIAERLGFDETGTGRVAIVASEAASNLVKHARQGVLVLGHGVDPHAAIVRMVALDRGPGIADVGNALRDGVSTAGSPGTGLGAMRRLASRFDVYSGRDGTIVLCDVARDGVPRTPAGALLVGALSVPKPGEEVCGDAWEMFVDGRRTILCVVDGLGHGPDAAAAALATLDVVRRHVHLGPADILRRAHEAVRATRGAAASIAELNADTRLVRFAGIGNVAGAILADGGPRHMVSQHGTLGHDARRFDDFTYPWPRGAVVLLHTDGIATRWAFDAYPGILERHPMLAAAVLYRDFSRNRDDATVVAVREAE